MRGRGARAGGLLGAHVSVQGGMATGPARGAAIGATAIQVFTKTPNQWREPVLARETCGAFRRAWERSGITTIVAHDSYLINLATPDPVLRRALRGLLRGRARRGATALGIPWVVSHPGNFIDDRDAGTDAERRVDTPRCLARRARAGRRPAGDHGGLRHGARQHLRGAGRAAGTRSARTCGDRVALLRRHLPPLFGRLRSGAATSTASGGGGTTIIGLARLRCLHLNDSKTPFGSRRDRHELIGEGSLGPEPFRRIMRDPRFEQVVKVLETPKGDDEVTYDRRMLRRLRAYARGPR